MFSTLRNRFGIPGVISVMALVFAMFGGAYAASNSASGKATVSAKAKKGPRGPKGATGPVGPVGPVGAKGDAGAAGSNGVSVTSTESANAIEGHCTGTGTSGKGGSKFVSAAGTTYACNGKNGSEGPEGPEGSPWTLGGTLPEGATETGTFFAGSETGEGPISGFATLAPISFPIPLATPVLESSHAIYVNGGALDEHCENTEHPGVANAANPEADPGYLCVYLADGSSQMRFEEFLAIGTEAVGVSGVWLFFETGAAHVFVRGTWAVTAP